MFLSLQYVKKVFMQRSKENGESWERWSFPRKYGKLNVEET